MEKEIEIVPGNPYFELKRKNEMSPKREQRIVSDKNICHGKPIIKGTRIMVTNILSLVGGGYDTQKILDYYPELTIEDVKAVIEYAIESIEGEDVQLLEFK